MLQVLPDELLQANVYEVGVPPLAAGDQEMVAVEVVTRVSARAG